MPVAAGARLGPYEIESLIGKGGMGEVYRARDTRLDRTVAIKLLPADLSAAADRRARFEREAHTIAQLAHPHICTLYDVGSHDGATYLVMEHLAGETLATRIATGPLPVAQVLEIGAQIADALAAAHKQGVVHRDLKPANVMLVHAPSGPPGSPAVPVRSSGPSGSPFVKLLDFGLAKLHAHGETPAVAMTTVTAAPSLTARGTILGTLPCMAPEQVQGQETDARTDLWALGAILYELLTGARAFEASSAASLVGAILEREPAPINTRQPLTPPALDRLVRRCLAKHPDDRWDTAHDVAEELRGIAQDTTHPPVVGRAVRGARRSKLAIGAAAAGLLILVSAGVYRWSNRSAPATIDSLAILPLTSDDSQTDYLSDGITEVLINSLSRLPSLKVLARHTVFRYKGAGDPIKVGRELGVRAVLTGKLMLRGDTLTIQVDLLDVASSAEIWGDRQNRKLADVLAVQEEVAQHISEALRPRFTGEQQRPARHSTENAEAYQFYLKGRFHWNRLTEDDVRRSIGYFDQALARDPRYALAYVGLSDAYGVLGQIGRPPAENAAQARAAADKALELDDMLPEAHTARGACELFYGWDWEVAERELTRAIELNNGPAHDLYGQFLYARGRFDEGIAEIRTALEVDPLSALSNSNLAQAYYVARQYDRAIEQCRRIVELDPDFFLTFLYRGSAHAQRGEYLQAVTALLKARNLPGGFAPATSELGYVYAISGRRREAQEMLRELDALASRRYIDPYYVAIIHVGLGDLDRTFTWLERAFEERSFWLLYLNVEPKFDRLRPEPRFAALQRRLNLPKQRTAAASHVSDRRAVVNAGGH